MAISGITNRTAGFVVTSPEGACRQEQYGPVFMPVLTLH